MSLSQALYAELQHEAQSTRKILEAVPEKDFGWKPHEKSFTMAKLASHITEIPGWINETLNIDVFEMKRDEYKPFVAQNPQELLAAWDKNLAAGLAHLKGYPEDKWMRVWKMVINGQTFLEMPRAAVMRGFVMNHLVHHRAQLGVYLRLRNVAVPPVYGPTADFPPMT